MLLATCRGGISQHQFEAIGVSLMGHVFRIFLCVPCAPPKTYMFRGFVMVNKLIFEVAKTFMFHGLGGS